MKLMTRLLSGKGEISEFPCSAADYRMSNSFYKLQNVTICDADDCKCHRHISATTLCRLTNADIHCRNHAATTSTACGCRAAHANERSKHKK